MKKKLESLFKTALILLPALIITLFSVHTHAQDGSGDIGSFDIDKVYEDVAAGEDTALADPDGSLSAFTRQPENYALVMLRIVGYLVIVTLIVFALAWGIRKFGAAGVSRVGAGSNMDIIETLYLGQNKGVALIRVGDVVYLLGHTADNIVELEKIEGEKAIELIASAKGGSAVMNFKDVFNNFMGKMKKT